VNPAARRISVTAGGSASENGSGPPEAPVSEGSAQGDIPLVALGGLPDHHHQAPAGAHRPADGGERGAGVVEEHHAEPADRQIEAPRRKAVDLRVGLLEGDVAQVLRLGQPAGALDRGRRDVDPERTARPGRPRGLPGGQPGAAADVQDVVVEPDAGRPAQGLVVMA
jgi:hypothetical protein